MCLLQPLPMVFREFCDELFASLVAFAEACRAISLCMFRYHCYYLANILLHVQGVLFFFNSHMINMELFKCLFYNVWGITTHLSLRMTPSITAISSGSIQHGLRFCAMWSLFFSHPLVICSFICYKWLSCVVSCCSLHISMHCWMFVVVSMVLMLTYIPATSLSLFSLWFCLDSQSAMMRSGPSLYVILTLYWWILRRILCGLCDNVATSFLNIVTSGLWLVIILTCLHKQ